jgi:S1-C subfamily serine protease
MRRTFAVLLLLAECSLAQMPASPPGCAGFSPYVYKIVLQDESRPPHKGPVGYGGGIFLSPDGDFLTATHVFEQSPHAGRVFVEVRQGIHTLECPVESARAFSRTLDLAIVKVRLGSLDVKVPPLGSHVRTGDQVFGFRFFLGPVCTTGTVSAVSSRAIRIRGSHFIEPGSSGCPIFNNTGEAVAIAVEMQNLTPGAKHAEYSYTGVPVERSLSLRARQSPLLLQEFLSALRAGQDH